MDYTGTSENTILNMCYFVKDKFYNIAQYQVLKTAQSMFISLPGTRFQLQASSWILWDDSAMM